jgi:hypothetical protein
MKSSTSIIVIYDSITNSVFASQVLQPALTALDARDYARIIIISYEPHTISDAKLAQCIPTRADLQLIIIRRRLPFVGSPMLAYAALRLRRILRQHTAYDLLARGPIAGWIALKARTAQCTSLIIQARGLLAQEYAYTRACAPQHSKNSALRAFRKYGDALRTRLYAQLEANVYSSNKPNVIIQAVSPALAKYLVDTYHAWQSCIQIATHDIPAKISPDTVHRWRTAQRTQLNIAHDAPVFCYNGSGKAWQCPALIFSFFRTQLAENPHSVLLILTQDPQEFAPFITHELVSSVIIKSVTHHEMYEHLAAADVGMLFREQSIVNWVSRPTKMLEYEAVGLKVVHNNTIAWLAAPKEILN